MSSAKTTRSARQTWPDVLPWHASIGAFVAAFVACFVFFVNSRLGQWIDDAALQGGQAFLGADATRKPALDVP